MVEHLAVNEVVPGSSPGDGVILPRQLHEELGSEYQLSRLWSPLARGQADESQRANVRERDRLGEFEPWRQRVFAEQYVRSVGSEYVDTRRDVAVKNQKAPSGSG